MYSLISSRVSVNNSAKLRACYSILFRTFLSSNYSCEDLWSKRLQNDTLKHVSTERYFFELNQKYQQKINVSAVDIDIFANSVHKIDSQDELEHIVRKFRQTKLTVDTLDSTHHAVCRYYLSHGKREKLLSILNQRIEYGIFPDTFVYNMLLDQSIKDNNLEHGFETVKLMMLQEDSGNDISKTLALYILNKLRIEEHVGLKEANQEAQEETAEQEDDDEIEYIRVPFITNPYFDDHFDLTNRDHIYGKSLYFFGHELKNSTETADQTLSLSSQIMGLVFYQKWTKLNKLLDKAIKKDFSKLTNEPAKLVEKHLELFSSDENLQKELKIVQQKLSQFPVTEDGLELKDLIDKRLKVVNELEKKDIELIKQMYEQFESKRIETLNKQLDKLLLEQKRKEIEQKKRDLEEKKRLYYFFENFPKHEIDFVEAEKRINELKSQTVVDEEYIPPENY